MTRERIRISAGAQTIVIDPSRGARIESWRVDGVELLVTHAPHPVEYGMYAMVPWAGRLRDNSVRFMAAQAQLPVTYGAWAMHGTIVDAPADGVFVDETPDGVRVVADFHSHPQWPWEMSVQLEYLLSAEALTTTIRITGRDEPFPVVVGWHPWFRRRLEGTDDCVWSIEADGMLERGEDELPTGVILPMDRANGPFDDAFRVPTGVAQISWPGGITLDVSGDANWFVLYDKPQNSVCLEPQSGPPDGLRSTLDYRLISPDEPWSWTTRWQVRDALPADPA